MDIRSNLKGSCLVLLLFIILSCVDRVNFVSLDTQVTDIVVDGLITDEPGPYTVKLSTSLKLEEGSLKSKPFSARKVVMMDNVGNCEELREETNGTYQTNPNGIRGIVGRKYYIRIETFSGQIFESIPDEMLPVGGIDSLYYKFVTQKTVSGLTQYGYRVFMDSHYPDDGQHFVRWKFEGTFQIETLPNLHPPRSTQVDQPCIYEVLPCSQGINENGIKISNECICCSCWVTQYESRPKVGSNKLSVQGRALNVEIGYVPVNFYTFQVKYRVQGTLMSLSKNAFEYWKIIQSQKDGATSLFQPPSGKLRTNVFELNGRANALGIFYASSSMKKNRYLTLNGDDLNDKVIVPIDCQKRKGPAGESCIKLFPFSSNQPPADWQ